MASSFFRAKKFLMSRVSDTKLGRAQLMKAVGEDTANLIEALTRITEKFIDKPTADEINRLTIKLAGKVALLFRENVVTPEAATPMQDPLNDAACRLVEGLEGKPGSVDSTAAAAAIEAAGAALLAVVRSHMKEKNAKAIGQLAGFYSGAAFLSFLFNSPKLLRERDTVLTCLHAFMAPRGGAGSKRRTLPCAVGGCELPRLKMRGAQYCQGHQAVKYAAGPPARLEEFTHNPEHAAAFKDFVANYHPDAAPAAGSGAAVPEGKVAAGAARSSSSSPAASSASVPHSSVSSAAAAAASGPNQGLLLLEFVHAVADLSGNANRAVVRGRVPLVAERYLLPPLRFVEEEDGASGAVEGEGEGAEVCDIDGAGGSGAAAAPGARAGAASACASAKLIAGVPAAITDPIAAAIAGRPWPDPGMGMLALLAAQRASASAASAGAGAGARASSEPTAAPPPASSRSAALSSGSSGSVSGAPRAARASSLGLQHLAAPGAPAPLTARLFDEAVEWAMAQLQALYEGPFRASPQYAAWAADNLGYELPPIPAERAALLAGMGIDISAVIPAAAASAAGAGAGAASVAAASPTRASVVAAASAGSGRAGAGGPSAAAGRPAAV